MLDAQIASLRDHFDDLGSKKQSEDKCFVAFWKFYPPCHSSKRGKKYAAKFFCLRFSCYEYLIRYSLSVQNKNLCYEETWKMKICINAGKKLTVAYGFIL